MRILDYEISLCICCRHGSFSYFSFTVFNSDFYRLSTVQACQISSYIYFGIAAFHNRSHSDSGTSEMIKVETCFGYTEDINITT